MTETAAKKDVQKLQRTVVDSLEDVKAQQLVVFDTEHISSLFERVVIASGTSNRQTKALAASVRDKVREAGFPKPRIEGEDKVFRNRVLKAKTTVNGSLSIAVLWWCTSCNPRFASTTT